MSETEPSIPLPQRVKNILRLRDPQARNLALDLGLLKGHQDYTRFIILGRSRTGSNFLRGLLDSHPGVTCFSELFQNRDQISWGEPYYTQSPATLKLFRTQPIQFLERWIFRKVPLQIEAVGFKIFYYHAQEGDWQPVWPHLLADKQLHVLHIKRRNMLETHLSKERARQSGQWANISGKKEAAKPVTLDYDACLQDFITTSNYERSFDERLSDHPLHEVIYEDLAADYDGVFQGIRRFLHLSDAATAPQTHKQAHDPLSRAIANYAQLKARFAGSEWESFFED